MDFTFTCALCERALPGSTDHSGMEIQCPDCSKVNTIPYVQDEAALVNEGSATVTDEEGRPVTTILPAPPPFDAMDRPETEIPTASPVPAQPAAPPPPPPPAPVAEAVHAAPVRLEARPSKSVDVNMANMLAESYQAITAEVGKLIVGQDAVIEQLLIAIFSRSHCLLEGVPGLAKTFMVKSLSDALALSFRRVQFTPDLMPADITGTDVIQEDAVTGQRKLSFLKGPLFAQMILADEINRSPPKTQAALLEAMQEHSITIGGHTYQLEEPFFVLATQNPVEQEGTYQLPEAQKDRFMFLVKVDYPGREEEREIIKRTTSAYSATIEPVLSGEQVIEIQRTIRKIPVPDHVMDFVLDLVRRSRPDDPDASKIARDWIGWGPGPRACQQLVLGGKVRAILRGRFHVTIDDVEALALPVLRHRIVPTFNAEAEGIKVDEIIEKILEEVPRGKPTSAVG
jgi:MoxR-like ATPase